MSVHDWVEMLIWEAKREKPCGVFGQKVVTNPAEADFSMLTPVSAEKKRGLFRYNQLEIYTL